MTPLKPYLIRSIYQWIIDNQLTPHLMVNAKYPNVALPKDYIEDGKIILNIKPQAIQDLNIGNDDIQFSASFSGKTLHIVVPTPAVLAIYAKENGKGMIFDPEDQNDNSSPPANQKPAKPKLRIVK